MVKSLITLLGARQSSILSGALILMITVFASKFLGLIKYRLLVYQFNTSDAAIFIASFSFPDLLFQLLVFGTLSVAFIPIFTETLNKKGEEEAFKFASNILNLTLFVFIFLTILGFVFVSQINSILIPGFKGEQKIVTDQLTRLIMLGQIILVIGSFFVGIGQSFQRFIVTSLAPLFYNVGIIIGIAVLSPFLGLMGPAVGVIIGATLHVLVQMPFVNSMGFKYSFTFDFLNSSVKEVFRMMSIRNIGLAMEVVNDKVGIALASLISTSSVTLLSFAQTLQVMPIGLFGATMAQAALPILSREFAKDEKESFKMTLLTTLHQILFLTLPATAILVVLRIPVVRLVYGASQFEWSDTVLTGWTVAFLALGLSAQSVILLLVRGFYAIKDTKTPVMVSIGTVILNIALSMLFIRVFEMDVWGLGLSYSIATNISAVLLFVFLNKKIGKFDFSDVFVPAFKMLIAATTAAVALWIPIQGLDRLVFDTTKTVNLLILTSIASFFGLGVYIFLVWFMEVRELNTFAQVFGKIGRLQSNLRSQEIVQEAGTVKGV